LKIGLDFSSLLLFYFKMKLKILMIITKIKTVFFHTSAEMRRGFWAVAFCAADYKRPKLLISVEKSKASLPPALVRGTRNNHNYSPALVRGTRNNHNYSPSNT